MERKLNMLSEEHNKMFEYPGFGMPAGSDDFEAEKAGPGSASGSKDLRFAQADLSIQLGINDESAL